MTREQKDLLLRDLCARLPYGVKVRVLVAKSDPSSWETLILNGYDGSSKYRLWIIDPINLSKYGCHGRGFAVDEVKPYLRPMSSMTEEEKDYVVKHSLGYTANIGGGKKDEKLYFHFKVESFDWLNAHHFDYRGLIEEGLAIEVTEDNNPYKD